MAVVRASPPDAGRLALQGLRDSPGAASASSAPPAAEVQSGGVPRPEGVFRVAPGERLSVAMARYLQAQGWALEWNDPQDFVLQHGYEIDLASLGLPAAVARILAPYRLSAVLHSPRSQRVVAVGAARGRFVLEDNPEEQK
jgi:hypothetical protein